MTILFYKSNFSIEHQCVFAFILNRIIFYAQNWNLTFTFHLHFKNFTHHVTQYTFDNFVSDKTKIK